jgi:hypothetical protein
MWSLADAAYWTKQGLWPIAGNEQLFVENVFSTWLYTGNGSAQTIDNSIELGSGQSSGGYITLNGTNYLKSPSSSAFAFGTGDFTMEAWIYPTSVSGTTGVVSTRIDASASSAQAFFGVAAGQILYYAGVAISGGTVAANNWYHIACSRSGTTVRIFLNGVQVGSGTDAVDKTTTFGFVGSGSGDILGQVFDGRISNARIVKGTALYTSNFTPSTTPLTAVSGTSLLTCQTPNLTADNSTNAFTLTQIGTIPTSLTGGPFPDATKGKGGLVWMKTRGANGQSHNLYDTVRGATNALYANATNANQVFANGLTSFNSNGFSLGSLSQTNFNNDNMASWTFREAPKFFDVVAYTGNGANRNIAHNLGVAPGMILVKRTDTAADWQVYHRSNANTQYMVLNSQAAVATGATRWNSTTPTSTEFTVGTDTTVNASGGTYVAYLYAHDTTSTGLIQCGSYTGNGSATGPTVTLGWEPQWLLVKRATGGTSSWFLIDSMRGFTMSNDNLLYAESTAGEETLYNVVNPTATGFDVVINDPGFNASGSTYVYMAIRRGPMQVPTVGTSVLSVKNYAATTTSASVTHDVTFDMELNANRDQSISKFLLVDGLRGINGVVLQTAQTTQDASFPTYWSRNGQRGMYAPSAFDAWWAAGSGTQNHISYGFVRAPGFFDEVCYTGTGVARTVNHNLGVVPEMMIVKSRTSGTFNWLVYSQSTGAGNYLSLNATDAVATASTVWNNTSPTATLFTVGTAAGANQSSNNFVAYLFASCPGVSKVGTYNGTGALQTINCGFTTGARFVLIKRTNSTGDWFVWDSTRGITSGNDPYLLLNSLNAEVTGTNYVDTDTTGFKVTAAAPAGINASGGTYIFLAIA